MLAARSNKPNLLPIHNGYGTTISLKRRHNKPKSPNKYTKGIANCLRQIMYCLPKSMRSKISVLNCVTFIFITIMLLLLIIIIISIFQSTAPVIDKPVHNDNQSLHLGSIKFDSPNPSISESNTISLETQAEIMRAKIWNRLKDLQEPDDCAEVEYLTCSVSRHCGFGCYIGAVLQCLAHGHKENKTVVLAKEKVFGGNSWSKYMLPVSKCQDYYQENKQDILKLDSTIEFNTGSDDWENHRNWVPDYTKDFLTEDNMIYPTGWFLGIMNGYLFRKFQPNVEKYIQRRITEMFGTNKTENDIHFNISCHIRRTDKVSWGEAVRFELREYVNEIDHAIIMKSPRRNFHGSYGKKYGLDVYLATDTPSIINEAKTKYGQYTWHYNDIGAKSANQNDINGRLNDQDTFYNAIFDLVMLSKSDYFVGTLSSFFGRTVFQLMANKYVDPSQYVLSLDEGYYAAV